MGKQVSFFYSSSKISLAYKMVSKRAGEIPPSGIRRFFDLAVREKDIVTLGIGEPDFDTPDLIKAAAIEAINSNKTHYTSNLGVEELREKIAKKLSFENGISGASSDNVLITSGSSQGLDLALRAVVDEGDEVLIPDPAYTAYAPLIMLTGAKPVYVPTYEKNGFVPQREDMEKVITKKTKAMLFCSPNNPTGAVYSKKALEDIADLAIKNDFTVISDEIYERLLYEGKHYSIAGMPEMHERTITLNGFSKAYASTGWRVGYIQAEGDVFDAIYKIHQYMMMCAPSVSQYAMIPAFDTEDKVAEMVKVYDTRRKLIVNGLNSLPGVSCHMPKGAFYAFPNITGTGMTSEEFVETAIRDAKVATVPGSVFGPCGEGHVRCSYATSTDAINEALLRLDAMLSKNA